MPSYLKPSCPCGDPRCKAFGAINPKTGHSRKCWDGCPTCAKGAPKSTGSDRIPPKVRRQVMARAGGFCEARVLEVCTGQPEHLHHKRMRSQGGQHSASNLIACCQDCHDFIHNNVARSVELGLLARTTFEPESSAVVAVERVER